MTEPLPLTNRCGKCGEWFHNAHVCANSIKLSKNAALSASPAPAEPVQQDTKGEPVAWRHRWIGCSADLWNYLELNEKTKLLRDGSPALNADSHRCDWEPLYATPHPVQPEEAVARAARAVVAHWNEFGFEADFDRCMDQLERALSRQQDAGGAKG